MRLAIVTATLLASTSAFAADLAPRPYHKAPAPIAAVYNWTGFYIGVMGGYGWSKQPATPTAPIVSSDLSGGFGGGTIGYNWQAAGSPFVWGLEVDAAASSLKFTESRLGVVLAETTVRSFGTVTGRLGYAWDNVLLYAKGGFAWADINANVVNFASDSHTHAGWALGGGLEVGVGRGWSVKGEYVYMDFKSQRYFNLVDFKMHTHTVKAGLNYRF